MSQSHFIQQRLQRLLPNHTGLVVAKKWTMKAVARTLLVAYALFLLKPVMPILMDKLAHTFWANVHLAVVHKINGKEHVHFEMRKAAADNEKEKAGQKHNPTVEEDAYSLPNALVTHKPILMPTLSIERLACYLRSHLDADVALEYPPPKLS